MTALTDVLRTVSLADLETAATLLDAVTVVFGADRVHAAGATLSGSRAMFAIEIPDGTWHAVVTPPRTDLYTDAEWAGMPFWKRLDYLGGLLDRATVQAPDRFGLIIALSGVQPRIGMTDRNPVGPSSTGPVLAARLAAGMPEDDAATWQTLLALTGDRERITRLEQATRLVRQWPHREDAAHLLVHATVDLTVLTGGRPDTARITRTMPDWHLHRLLAEVPREQWPQAARREACTLVYAPTWRPGDRFRHATYGLGTVAYRHIDEEGTPAATMLVEFDQPGATGDSTGAALPAHLIPGREWLQPAEDPEPLVRWLETGSPHADADSPDRARHQYGAPGQRR